MKLTLTGSRDAMSSFISATSLVSLKRNSIWFKRRKKVSPEKILILDKYQLQAEILSALNFILTHWNNCLLAKCKNLYKFADKEIKKSGYWRFRCNGPSTSCSGPSPTLKQGKSALFAIDKSSKTWKTIFYHVIWTKS